MAVGGHTSAGAIIGVSVSVTAIALICVSFRIYTRTVLKKAPGVDDVFVGMAVLMSSVLLLVTIMEVHYGMSRHVSLLTEYEIIRLFFWFYISIFFYLLGLFFLQYSIVLMYLRIFPQKVFRRFAFSLMAFIAIYTAWAVFSNIFACTPIRRFWDPAAGGTHGRCYDRATIWYLNAGMTIFTDIAIILLPLPVIKSLNIRKRASLAMAVILYLGGVTCIVAIVRLQAVYAITSGDDVSWDDPLAAIWSSVELNIGITCSCIPQIREFAVWLFPGVSRSSQDKASEQPMVVTVGGSSPPGMQSRKSRAQSTTLLQFQQWEEEVTSPVERCNTIVECVRVQSSAGEQSTGAPAAGGISVLTSVKLDTSIDQSGDWKSTRTSSCEPV